MGASALRELLLALLALVLFTLCACDEGVAGNMADQPRYETWEPAPGAIFPGGAASRHPPSGTEPRLAAHDAAVPALEAATAAADFEPPPLTPGALARGRELFDIRCALCHAPDGYGEGVIVRRGFPSPPSLHEQRLRDAPDEHLYTVITSGLGTMQPQGPYLVPRDRWAIVAYIRALQLSQNARAADLPPDVRARLPGAP